MRLTIEQIRLVVETVTHVAGATAGVCLFGSRTDDQARGGDVDLLVETDTRLALIDRARIKMALESGLGLPVDIVARTRDVPPTAFQSLAQARAVRMR